MGVVSNVQYVEVSGPIVFNVLRRRLGFTVVVDVLGHADHDWVQPHGLCENLLSDGQRVATNSVRPL